MCQPVRTSLFFLQGLNHFNGFVFNALTYERPYMRPYVQKGLGKMHCITTYNSYTSQCVHYTNACYIYLQIENNSILENLSMLSSMHDGYKPHRLKSLAISSLFVGCAPSAVVCRILAASYLYVLMTLINSSLQEKMEKIEEEVSSLRVENQILKGKVGHVQ